MTPLAGRWTLGEPVRRDGLGDVLWATGPEGETAWVRLFPSRIAAAPALASDLAALPRVTARHLCRLVDAGVVEHEGRPAAYVAHAVDPAANDLTVLLQQGPLTPQVAARVAADACWGLTAAHTAGLVHGALSARDVVLTGDVRGSKVVGVGIFPLVRDALGTSPPRSAPEVRAGEAPTVASDLWSVGALLRTCLGDLADSDALPEALRAELATLLDPDPANRPRSARVVATRLVSMATGLRDLGQPAAPRPPRPPRPSPAPVVARPPVTPRPPAVPPVATPPPPPPVVEPAPVVAAPEPVRPPEPKAPPAPEPPAPVAELPPPPPPAPSLTKAKPKPEPEPVLPEWTPAPAPVPAALEDKTGPMPTVAPSSPPVLTPPAELEHVEDPRLRRLLIGASIAALVLVAIVLVLLHSGGSDSSEIGRTPTVPGVTASAPASSTPTATATGSASNPAPILATPVVTDPQEAARLTRIALTAGDVGTGAKRQKIPDATDFNSYVRAMFASCDYYTPVGSPRTGHRIVRFDLPSGVEVINDVTDYPVNAQQVVDGMKTSVARCGTLSLSENGAVVGTFKVQAPAQPIPGLPASATELEYISVKPADDPIRLIAFAKGKTLDVVIVRGATTAALLDPARRAVQSAMGRLSAVALG